jgi:regulatory protein
MAEDKLFDAALSRAMALCSGREYCISDIMGKLRTWGVAEAGSAKIISCLIKDNFIDEKRYAEAFVKDKFMYNKWGRVKLRAGLRGKKISDETIKNALESIDDETYISTLSGLLETHRKKIRAKNQYDMKGKLLRYGLSKGFESDLLYRILGDPQ